MFRSKRFRVLLLTAAAGLLATTGAAQMRPLGGDGVMATVERLRPGQYIWLPEIAPKARCWWWSTSPPSG